MKIKGISFFEQHIEKIVLGTAGVAFVAFAAWQFVHKPNLVSVDNRKVEPGEINGILATKAEALQQKLSPTAPPAVDLPDPVRAGDLFAARQDASLIAGETLPQVILGLRPELEILERADKEYVVPTITPPFDVVAAGYAGKLTEGITSSFPGEFPEGLEGVVPGGSEPPDLIFVTAAATFDIADFETKLKAGDPAKGQLPVPASFYNERLDIMDVEIEREELVNGVWSNTTLLPPIPGQFHLRAELVREDQDTYLRDEIRGVLADPAMHAQLVRPQFYPTVNDAWTPPVEAQRTEADDPNLILSEEAEEIAKLRRQIRKTELRLANDSAELEELGGPPTDEDKPPKRDDGDGGGGEGGGGFGGGGNGLSGGGGARGRRDNTSEETQRRLLAQRRGLSRQVDKHNRQLERLRRALLILVPEPDPADATDLPEATPFDMDGRIRVWGHDVTVTPGGTYRYRVRVELYNPFFARRLNLVEAQTPLAESMTMASAFSAWSAPVKVPETLAFFVTRAYTARDRGAQAKTASATAEVYRFYDGIWHVESFTLEPGDRIGAMEQVGGEDGATARQIDFGTDWFVLDIDEDIDVDPRSPQRKAGYGAIVLLQNATTGEVTAVRRPRRETRRPERIWLRDEVERGTL